jgi:DNA polymerase-1
VTKEEAIQKAKILKDLIELNKVSKILDSFIPVFLNKTILKEDRVYLHGNFNLGGTVSGRLSSSRVNLQQLPSSGSVYAKPIKKCFQAPEGWLMVGADFSSLEDRISALTTKDPNKLAVYEKGYCGHCLRAYFYWKDKFPNIELASEKELCYKAKVGGTEILFKESDTINFKDKLYSAKEFYELATSKKL